MIKKLLIRTATSVGHHQSRSFHVRGEKLKADDRLSSSHHRERYVCCRKGRGEVFPETHYLAMALPQLQKLNTV